MEKVTIGCIGVGEILDAHLKGLRANPEYELVSICRRSEDKLHRMAAQLGCEGFTNYHELLAQKPDVVLVSLPHGLHCRVTLEAFEAGCHVLVEKPMAVSLDECNRMLRAAHERGRHLIVTEAASFTPGAILTGQRFKAGELGRFFTGSIINERFYFHEGRPRWFLDPAMSGGGMFINVGVHRLATARACLPGLVPVSVSASVCYLPDHDCEACTSAIVRYKEGGSMLYEEVGYYPKPEWLNVGTHFVFEEGIVTWDDRTWRLMRRDGRQIGEALPAAGAPYAPVYANMLRAIRGEEYGPKARECALDVAVAQAAYVSARDKREIYLTSGEWIDGPTCGIRHDVLDGSARDS